MAYVIMRQRQTAICISIPVPIRVIDATAKDAKKYVDQLNSKSSMYDYYKVKVPSEILCLGA